jgi:hypothetical protein
MRNIREYYEGNFTPGNTRNENLTGPLQDTVGRIFEHMENEECSLALLVRALSILLWLVKIQEDNGISLNQQTREEVEACAAGLTREYLQRGRYNPVDLIWALEWASTRTIKEIAPQVPHGLIESLDDPAHLPHLPRLPRVTRVTDLAGLAGLADIAGLANITDSADIADIAATAGLARVAVLAGLARICMADNELITDLHRLAIIRDVTDIAHLTDLVGDVAVPRFGSLARLALDDTPETIH